MATLKFKTADGRPDPKGLSETEVREIVRDMLGTAFRDHSRSLEQHLADIHQRLTAVEDKTR
jgi:hypothetical protein